jgi:hypothetical protein
MRSRAGRTRSPSRRGREHHPIGRHGVNRMLVRCRQRRRLGRVAWDQLERRGGGRLSVARKVGWTLCCCVAATFASAVGLSVLSLVPTA